jgi:hypothetical protein
VTYKEILVGLLNEYRRANDLREREIDLKLDKISDSINTATPRLYSTKEEAIERKGDARDALKNMTNLIQRLASARVRVVPGEKVATTVAPTTAKAVAEDVPPTSWFDKRNNR